MTWLTQKGRRDNVALIKRRLQILLSLHEGIILRLVLLILLAFCAFIPCFVAHYYPLPI